MSQHSRAQSRPVAVIQPQRPSSANIKDLQRVQNTNFHYFFPRFRINSIVEERTKNLSQDLETTKKKLEYLEKELACSTQELSFYRNNFGSGKSRSSFPTSLLSKLSESKEDMFFKRQNHQSTMSMPSHYEATGHSLKKQISNPVPIQTKVVDHRKNLSFSLPRDEIPSEKLVRIPVVAASCSDLSSTFDQSTLTDSSSGESYSGSDDETLNGDDGIESRSHYSVSPIGSGSLSTISRTLEDDCQAVPRLNESNRPVPIQEMETLQNSPAMQSQLLQRLVHLKHSREMSKITGYPSE
ncbi:Oidioi.mRNA.OKI2018_I69.PAR.g10992.t1.cds [Oikopleura dioica]|uniref:Oidioi.mRNA.OKI2018_I69.PAR.g10992.t1.cds n=1 Tax=Oikopleura dioica TaxID=34765 RepID=A0ABN7RTE5_OIKDI|nr:Oidioi.mRNA.OKI2018_I69.PAR.g10992.t1.cds [Oikopleura dioica]